MIVSIYPLLLCAGRVIFLKAMFNLKTLLSEFTTLIGVRPAHDVRSAVLTPSVKQSDSGLYINAAHPLLTVDNIEATANDIQSFAIVQQWESANVYAKGDIVSYGDKWYESIADDNEDYDVTNTAKWVETSLVNQYLKDSYLDAVTRVFRRIELDKQIANKGRRLVNSIPLFFVEGKELNEKVGAFVGLRLWVQGQDLAGVLNKIGLQLKQAQNLTVYLFHTSSATAVKTWTVNYTNAQRFQWFAASESLDFSDTNGYYTIGYFESDLQSGNVSMRRKLDFEHGPNCTHCNQRDYDYYQKWSSYLSVETIRVPSAYLDGVSQVWQESEIEVMPIQNYGLNLNLSVNCDLTNVVVANKGLFANVIFEQWKILLLENIAFTARNNRLGNVVAQPAHFALHDPNNRDNPYNSLDKAFGAIEVDFSGLNPICLPCEDLQNSTEIDTVWG